MSTIYDDEFGEITVRRTSSGISIKVTIASNGQLRITAPRLASIFSIMRMIATSRHDLRRLLATRPTLELKDGLPIGKSHHLRVRPAAKLALHRHAQELILSLPADLTLQTPHVVDLVRQESVSVYRREAKAYLPKRVAYLAQKYGFHYKKLRFSHASTRWGSCSTTGTLSLNIGLMKLPHSLIDYVIIHELAHTKEMNHSVVFWEMVEDAYPDYKAARAEIKKYSPGV